MQRWIGQTIQIAIVVLCCSDPRPLFAQLRFEPSLVKSNVVQLSLLGDAGVGYAIESSTDLADWSLAFTGIAESGRFQVEVPLDHERRSFYRARLDDEPLPEQTIDIKPSALTNLTGRLVALENESIGLIYAGTNRQFSLTFPSNTVANATFASMTLVTNISGLPFAGPLLGAVRIEFDDEEMLGAVALRIPLGTNTDYRKMVSFGTALDGTGLYLTPNRVDGASLLVPITQSGIYGACFATPEELARVLATISSPVPAETGASGLRPQGILKSSRLCFSQDVARALAVRKRITKALNQFRSKWMVQLNESRQAQLAGTATDSGEVLASIVVAACDFYNRNIAPRWAEASRNCSLMGVLLQFGMGLERQLLLLGIPDAQRCTANILSAQTLCPGFKDCLQEIRLCCIGGHQGRERLRDLATLIRQQALLGIEGHSALGCYTWGDPVVEEVIDVCTPRTWTGSIQVKEIRDSHERTETINGFSESTRQYEASYRGFITDAAEINQGSFGIQANFTIEGAFQVREYRRDYGEAVNPCGKNSTDDLTLGFYNDNGAYIMSLQIRTNGNYFMTLNFAGKDEKFTPAMGTEWSEHTRIFAYDIDCSTKTDLDSGSHELSYGSASLPFFNGAGNSVNLITGKTNFVQGFPPSKIEISWKLQRKIKPQ